VAEALSIKFDTSGLNARLDALLVKSQAAIRPAAQSGAQLYYDEVKLNVSRIGKKTGNLAASIYQVYSKDNSSKDRATYHISWNTKKAPHGHLVEFGHIQTRKVYIGSDGNWYTSKALLPNPKQVGARPFIRPAFGKAQAALEAANARFVAEMKESL